MRTVHTSPDFAALKVILLLLAILATVVGLLLLFGARPLAVLAPADLHLLPVLSVGLLMVLGILELGFGYLLYLASRDPIRYVGVIDTIIFFLFAGALFDLYVAFALHALLGSLGWFGAGVRLLLAIFLTALRPRGISAVTPWEGRS